MENIHSLYIHIPFCDHICAYCDFPKILSSCFSHETYISSLIEEIDSLKIADDSLETIYIGGGTPTALDVESFTRILTYLSSRFRDVKEFTIEANPESIDEEKCRIMKENGVNRVSIGVEVNDSGLLNVLGRKHSKDDVVRGVSLLREHGIDNINLDFIYSLPSKDDSYIDKDIDLIKELDPDHVSFYSLQIEEGTLFYNKKMEVDDDRSADQYERINKELGSLGYERYEVSNFAKKGFESKHNLTYWHDLGYYAAGMGASGYLPSYYENGDGLRYTDSRSMTNYLKREGVYKERITKKDEEFEYLMLNLRLKEGFLLSDFESRFRVSFLEKYKKEIEETKDYLQIDESVKIKPRFLFVMDSILLKILN